MMNEFNNGQEPDTLDMQASSDTLQNSESLLDISTVMQAYGVAHWENLGPLESLHTATQELLVEIDGQHYVLRERPEGPAGEDSHFRYDFQNYLRQTGIPLPFFRLTPQGEPMVKIGEDYFELQQQIGGELFSTSSLHSLEWVASAGIMLGRIHQASSTYTGHQHRWPSEAHIGAIVQRYLDIARSNADQVPLQAIAGALSEWVDQWEAVLPQAMMSIGAHHALPEWHIHGDYHALNLRFGPFGVSAVTGLEAARWEKRIFEVAYALFYFSALTWLPGSAATPPLVKRGFDPERVQRFLSAYGKLCPPVQGEATLLIDALTLISPIATLNGPLEDLFYFQGELDSAVIDDVMERLSWAIALPAWLGRVRRSFAEMWV